jgi:hypothetical protein
MNRRIAITLVALLIALATWYLGWLSVPVIALLHGLWRREVWPPTLAAVLAWSALLALDALGGRFGALATSVGGVIGVPAAGPVIVTIVFAALLAASAATLGTFVGVVVMTRRKGVVA